MNSPRVYGPKGMLALQAKKLLPVQVLSSAAGYYLGTADENGPFTRESCEYWNTRAEAQAAYDSGNWTQRTHP